MTPGQIGALQKWVPTIGMLVAIGVAWGVLTAAVKAKADISDVHRVEAKVDANSVKLDALVRLACRADHGDSICPYK